MTEIISVPVEVVHSFSTDDVSQDQDTTELEPIPFLNIIRNFRIEPISEKTDLHIGLTLEQISLAIQIATDHWPRRIGTRLFGLGDDDEVVWLDGPNQLTSWLSSKDIQLDWRSNSKGTYIQLYTKSEFLAFLQMTVKQYEELYDLPHYPPIKNAYYTPKAMSYIPEDNGLFIELVDLFCHFSPADRVLIASFFATPFWNCEPGSRPLFVIEGAPDDPSGGVGIGKSILVDAVASLSSTDGGGYIDVPESKFEPDEIKRRIINDDSTARVVRYDNIKKARLSSEVLESMITTSVISGHKLRHGHSTKKNRYTYVMTFNDAALSKDLASRAVRIRLARPPEREAGWKKDLLALIRVKKKELISNLLWHLAHHGDNFRSSFRFEEWTEEVLGKFTKGVDISSELKTSREDLNDEVNEIEEMESTVANRLRGYFTRSPSDNPIYFDPEQGAMFVPNALLVKWLNLDLGQKYYSATQIKKLLSRGNSKFMRNAKTRLVRGVIWSPNGTTWALIPSTDDRVIELRDAKSYSIELVK